MERVTLSVEIKQGSGKGVARKLRAKDRIPGIIYGKGFENISIHADSKTTENLFSSSSSLNKMIDLQVPGHGTVTTLLKDYQADIFTRRFTHLDFIKVDLTKKLRVEVPIEPVGKAEGVKEGGVMDVVRREIPIICLPADIPAVIEVDVSHLKIGQSLHLSDLKLDPKFEIPRDINYTLISVAATRAEETPAVAAEAAKEPEVLTAKKPAEGAATEEKKATKPEKK